jgi:hypothetical protein
MFFINSCQTINRWTVYNRCSFPSLLVFDSFSTQRARGLGYQMPALSIKDSINEYLLTDQFDFSSKQQKQQYI